MKLLKIVGVVASGIFALAATLSNANAREISIMSWNVENLFDTEDDPNRSDEEFLPEGKFEWTEEKLALKMSQLAKLITSVTNPDGSQCPDYIGMAEVENAQIAQRLNREYLQVCKYDKIIGDPKDPDPRGIRVVSMTRLPLATRPISHSPYKGGRFIQETSVLVGENALTIFMNHWKSRRSDTGGGDNGEGRRIESAKVLAARMGQLMTDKPEVDFVAMGDFNDEPENISLRQTLHSTLNLDRMIEMDFTERPFLWNPAGELLRLPAFVEFAEMNGDEAASKQFLKARGTYYYGGNKEYLALDNFHLAPGLLDEEGFSYVRHSYQVYRQMMTDAASRPVAFRAGANPRGFSDHFPILMRLKVNEVQ